MATEEEEKKGRNLFTKDEVVNILMDKKNWAEAAHVGLNYALEMNPLNKIPGKIIKGVKVLPSAAKMAKIAGPPLKLAQTAAEVGWALATPENRANNKRNMEELAETSVMNRLASGYLNTGANLAGGAQLLIDLHNSDRDAWKSGNALKEKMKDPKTQDMLRDVRDRQNTFRGLPLAVRSQVEAMGGHEQKMVLRYISANNKKKALDEAIARRAPRASVETLVEYLEPDPAEEASKIAKRIREQRELDVGGG
jgi:hypothetical protein